MCDVKECVLNAVAESLKNIVNALTLNNILTLDDCILFNITNTLVRYCCEGFIWCRIIRTSLTLIY